MDNGYWISEPTPVAYKRGKIPNRVVNAVMSTGRKRSSVASFITSCNSFLGSFSRNSSIKATKTIPFKMAMAKMAKNPMMAETER